MKITVLGINCYCLVFCKSKIKIFKIYVRNLIGLIFGDTLTCF